MVIILYYHLIWNKNINININKNISPKQNCIKVFIKLNIIKLNFDGDLIIYNMSNIVENKNCIIYNKYVSI